MDDQAWEYRQDQLAERLDEWEGRVIDPCDERGECWGCGTFGEVELVSGEGTPDPAILLCEDCRWRCERCGVVREPRTVCDACRWEAERDGFHPGF